MSSIRTSSWRCLAATFVAAMACCVAAIKEVEADQARSAVSSLPDKQITIIAIDEPLVSVIRKVGTQAGVNLDVAQNYEDRAITVRADRLSLQTLLTSIATLYDDFWIKELTKHGVRYVLQPSLSRRSRQQELLRQQTLVVARAIRNKASEILNGNYSGKKLDPNSRFGRDLYLRSIIARSIPDDLMLNVLQGQSIRFSVKDSQGDLGVAIRQFVGEIALQDSPKDIKDQSWIQFSSRNLVSRKDGIPIQDLTFVIGTDSGGSSRYNLAPDPSEISSEMARFDELSVRSAQRAAKERTLHPPLWSKARLKPAADLRKGIWKRSEIINRIASEAQSDFVCDSHLKPALQLPDISGHTVGEALDMVCEASKSYWRVGPVTLIRSSHWWQDDVAEPPATVINHLKDIIATRGYTRLDEAIAFGKWTSAQQARAVIAIPTADSLGNGWIRFCATLSPAELRLARTTEGLPMKRVSLRQRQLILSVENNDYYGLLGQVDYERIVLERDTVLNIDEDVRPDAHTGGLRAYATFTLEPVPPSTTAHRHTHGESHQGRLATVSLPYDSRSKPAIPHVN